MTIHHVNEPDRDDRTIPFDALAYDQGELAATTRPTACDTRSSLKRRAIDILTAHAGALLADTLLDDYEGSAVYMHPDHPVARAFKAAGLVEVDKCLCESCHAPLGYNPECQTCEVCDE
jgi:hypothetical protein